jgi:hypothetical protein
MAIWRGFSGAAWLPSKQALASVQSPVAEAGTLQALTSHSVILAKTNKPAGNGPTGLLEELVMVGHRKLLPRIVVKIGIKVKITIVRK